MLQDKNKSCDVEEIRKEYVKAYSPWTPEEDASLKKAYDEWIQHEDVARHTFDMFCTDWGKRLGRKPGAIESRITKYAEGKEFAYQKKNKSQNKRESIMRKSDSAIPPQPQRIHIDLNPEFQKAYDLMEKTKENVFITGRAGTGKSTLLTYFRNNTKKKVVVLAPTGVAALNVKGQTIHSFFKFKSDITVQSVKHLYKNALQKDIYRKIEMIVIDEISMVRADLLDCINAALQITRNNHLPFGGVQMIFIGDLYQLPPVVTSTEKDIFKTYYKSPYFFDSHVFDQIEMEFIELEKVYRQKDNTFITLLNAVRNNSTTEEHLEQINARFLPNFIPDAQKFALYLTTTNDLADTINAMELDKLKTKTHQCIGYTTGHFDMKTLPTDTELEVKVGSQVMMLNNDAQGRWVNGTMGKIVGIEQDEDGEDIIMVEMANGNLEQVGQYTWELFHFGFDKASNSLISETVGTFTQYPLRLAWAVTIHKAQGKTFDNIIIDIGRGTFVHGQLYVALSRCTSLEGITLKQPIEKKHIFMDYRVVKFMTQFQYNKSDQLLPLEEKSQIILQAIQMKKKLTITYLKANDEKSKRIIHPLRAGEKEYLGKRFLGVDAYDEKSGEERVFKIDRILEIDDTPIAP